MIFYNYYFLNNKTSNIISTIHPYTSKVNYFIRIKRFKTYFYIYRNSASNRKF